MQANIPQPRRNHCYNTDKTAIPTTISTPATTTVLDCQGEVAPREIANTPARQHKTITSSRTATITITFSRA